MSRPGAWQGLASAERMGLMQLTPDQNFVQFTRPGTFYWVPPPGLLAVRVLKIDSGGGAGSGRIDPLATTIHCGGGGGGGGAASDHTIRIAGRPELFDRWQIIVGVGGLGGASVSGGSALDGNAGGAGVLSTVNIPWRLNTYALNNTGGTAGFGAAGTATAGAGGAAGVGPQSGGIGGTASPTGLVGVVGSLLATLGATGGGSGGGLTTSNATSAGGNGGTWTVGGTGLSVTAQGAGVAGGRGSDGFVGPHGWGVGGGGGGSSTTTGGDGGNGVMGSGGGGGGAATTTSGKGGNGGDGAVFLFLVWG